MSKIPSIDEALDEHSSPDLGTGRIKKNLHWYIGGGLVLVLAVILLSEALKMEATQKVDAEEAKRMERIKDASIDKKPEDISGLLAQQRKRGQEEAGEVPVTAVVPSALAGAQQPKLLPPLPSGRPGDPSGSSYQGMNPPASTNAAAEEAAKQERLAAQRREEASRAATILAIDTGYQPQSAAQASGNPYLSQSEKQLMAPGTMKHAGAAVDMQQTQRQIDELKRRHEAQRSILAGGGMQQTGLPSAVQPMTPVRNGQIGSPDDRWLAAQAAPGSNEVLTAKSASSPYMVLQGAVIPAVLVTEVNSDLPGQLTAQVTMDVYDSIRGDHLLIPKGSRLIGMYNNDLKLGQERVMAAFRRMIFPNGTYVDLMGMQISDAQGQSGVTGDVDNHFWKMFGASFATAGLAWLFQKKSDNNTTVVVNGTQQSSNTLTGAGGQILVDTARKITDRNANIPPTVTIKQGHRFNIIVAKDMQLAPYSQNAGF